MNHHRRICLFNALQVADHDRPLWVPGSRPSSLLAYLVLHARTSHPRERLAELLFPDAPAGSVRRCFSDALYRLRQALGAGWLMADSEYVGLHVDDTWWVDAWEFERLATHGDRAALEQAAALYTGDLLPEIYADWIIAPRLALQDQYLTLLDRLAAASEAEGDLAGALTHVRRLISVEPLRESAHETYLRLLGRLNRRAQALAHYDDARRLFRTQLGVELPAEMHALMDAIRRETDTAPTAPPVAERTRFVGRVRERQLGVERIEQVMAGQGGLWCIEGQAGIGKSRLLREWATSARWRGALTAYGRASEFPSASPFTPIAEALRPILDPRVRQVEHLVAPETLAAVSAVYDPWRGRAALPELPPAQARKRFHDSFVTLAQTLTRIAPLMLLLDDLHWADAALWDLLDALVPATRAAPLLLFLAYRRPGIEQNPGWQVLQKWDRAGYLGAVTLGPFDLQDVVRLLSQADGTEAARVIALTGGNPLHVTEYLARRGTLEARLRALSTSARAALEAAAALGEQVAFDLWMTLLHESPIALAAAGEELIAHSFLQATEDGYAFLHDVIRTAIYETIAPVRRVALHACASDAVATRDPQNWRVRAFHLERAGRMEEAGEAYWQVGAQEVARFAFREAQHALERALALLPKLSSRKRTALLLELVQACDVTGDRERQARAIDEGMQHLDSLPDPGGQARILIAAGDLATKTGHHPHALTFLSDALVRARRAANPAQQAEILIRLGDLELRTGDVQAAKSHYGQGLALARKCRDRVQEALALDGLGFVLPSVGGSRQHAEAYFLQALQVRRASGDHFGEARSLANYLAFLQTGGALDRVMALSDQALAANEAVGYRLGAAVVRAALGLAVCALGDFAGARQLITTVIDHFRSMGDADGVAVYSTSLGIVAEREGNLDEAATQIEAALRLAQAHHTRLYGALAQQALGAVRIRQGEGGEAIVLLEAATAVFGENNDLANLWRSRVLLGHAFLDSGECPRALTIADQAWDDFRRRPPGGEDPQYHLWALYQLLDRVGRSKDARHVLQAAYAALLHQAKILQDDQVRQSFFRSVPVNRAVAAAYFETIGRAPTCTITLARLEAPLGRTLTETERVAIEWTLHAPEDEAIAGKVARRRYRLRRLLEEAQRQQAAPTDQDLARALGVSRHTILRDMATLARERQRPLTRRRKPSA